MVRVVDCHAGVLGSNPGGPKIFSPWNYFTKYAELSDWTAEECLNRLFELVLNRKSSGLLCYFKKNKTSFLSKIVEKIR